MSNSHLKRNMSKPTWSPPHIRLLMVLFSSQLRATTSFQMLRPKGIMSPLIPLFISLLPNPMCCTLSHTLIWAIPAPSSRSHHHLLIGPLQWPPNGLPVVALALTLPILQRTGREILLRLPVILPSSSFPQPPCEIQTPCNVLPVLPGDGALFPLCIASYHSSLSLWGSRLAELCYLSNMSASPSLTTFTFRAPAPQWLPFSPPWKVTFPVRPFPDNRI